MNEFNSYKKLLGKPITVTWIINMNNGDRYKEYIQGVLKSVDESGIEIEQYLSFYDYLDGGNPPSKLRKFRFEDVQYNGHLPA